MSVNFNLAEADQDFLHALSSSLTGQSLAREQLHALVDELPAGAPAMLIVRNPESGEVAFETWGSPDAAQFTHMCQAAAHRIFSPQQDRS